MLSAELELGRLVVTHKNKLRNGKNPAKQETKRNAHTQKHQESIDVYKYALFVRIAQSMKFDDCKCLTRIYSSDTMKSIRPECNI